MRATAVLGKRVSLARVPAEIKIQSPKIRCPRSRQEKTLCPVPRKPLLLTLPLGFPLPLAHRGQLSSGTGGHPLFRVLRLSRRSGLHVARALVLRDEDGIRMTPGVYPVPRVPLRLLMDCTICSIIKNALPVRLYLGVIVRIRGCRWRTPMRWYRRRGPPLCSWIAGCSCRCSVTQHEIMSTLILCSVSGSVTCGLHLHCTTHLGVMLRSVEASVQGHLSEGCHPKHQERLGLAHRSRLARQTTPVYSRVSGTVSYCGRHPAGGPGHHSPVRAGSVRLCHQEPQGLTCLSRDSHGSRVGPS